MKRQTRRIRAKLLLLTSLSSGVALLIAGTLIGVNGYRHDHQALGERAQTRALVTASNSVAAVAFSDPVAAQKTLESLRPDAEIAWAAIFLADGTRLAEIDFPRPRGRRPVTITAPIVLQEQIGSVELSVSSARIEADLKADVVILLVVLAGSLLVALLCTVLLQRMIARPFLDLARTKRQLEKALEDANAAARAKSEFLANMSHEIRTPMNGVIGMLELVDSSGLAPEPRSMIETARGAADSLLAIINDVLDYSKIEAGKLTLESIEVDIRSIIEEVATLFAGRANARGLELICAIHKDVPARLEADPTRLRQILVNLVGNAVKFTERGEVFVGAQPVRKPGDAATQTLQIVVSDTGIGLAPQTRDMLFEAFTQADGSTTRRYGGTGLGLAITRRLVDAMGGSIRVKSALGEGTTFSVHLPMKIHAGVLSQPDVSVRGIKVLVVDDNPTIRCVLQHYLAHDGAIHQSAADARDGLALLREAQQAGQPFAAVLLDSQLPDVDGMQFVSELRADPSIARTRCIVLSSIGDRVSEASDPGVDTWIAKPVRASQLRVALASLPGTEATKPRTPGSGTRGTSFEGARVLLVEDNEVNQKVAARMLKAFGVEAHVVSDGSQAVHAAQAQAFDLILMDCQMPVMDGYTATAAIRAFSRIPIIALTANALAGDRERCLASGMDDFVAKPVKKEILERALSRWLAPTARVEAAAAAIPPASIQAGDDRIEALDIEALDILRELMQEDLPELIEQFLADVPRQLSAMEHAYERNDVRTLQRGAHSIKSTSHALGAQILGRVAERLEAHVGEFGVTEEVSRLIASLHVSFAAVSPYLQSARGHEAVGQASGS